MADITLDITLNRAREATEVTMFGFMIKDAWFDYFLDHGLEMGFFPAMAVFFTANTLLQANDLRLKYQVLKNLELNEEWEKHSLQKQEINRLKQNLLFSISATAAVDTAVIGSVVGWITGASTFAVAAPWLFVAALGIMAIGQMNSWRQYNALYHQEKAKENSNPDLLAHYKQAMWHASKKSIVLFFVAMLVIVKMTAAVVAIPYVFVIGFSILQAYKPLCSYYQNKKLYNEATSNEKKAEYKKAMDNDLMRALMVVGAALIMITLYINPASAPLMLAATAGLGLIVALGRYCHYKILCSQTTSDEKKREYKKAMLNDIKKVGMLVGGLLLTATFMVYLMPLVFAKMGFSGGIKSTIEAITSNTATTVCAVGVTIASAAFFIWGALTKIKTKQGQTADGNLTCAQRIKNFSLFQQIWGTGKTKYEPVQQEDSYTVRNSGPNPYGKNNEFAPA